MASNMLNLNTVEMPVILTLQSGAVPALVGLHGIGRL